MPKLPTVEHPVYRTEIFSNGKSVEFRPFTTGEERVLLTANEDQTDIKNQLIATRNVINACTFNNIDLEKLPNYDIENLFLKIRMQSVAPTVTQSYRCLQPMKNSDEFDDEGNPICGGVTDIEIDLSNIDVETFNHDTRQYEKFVPTESTKKNIHKVECSDTIGFTFRHPVFIDAIEAGDLSSQFIANGDSYEYDGNGNPVALKRSVQEEIKYRTLYMLLIDFYDGETVLTKGYDYEYEDFKEFLDSLSRDIHEKIDNAMELPHVHQHVNYACQKCGHKTDFHLRGMQDFLG